MENNLRLTRYDIQKINEKFEKSKLHFSLDSSGSISIHYRENYLGTKEIYCPHRSGLGEKIINEVNKDTRYKFSFGVSEKRLEDFNEILSRMEESYFSNSFVVGDGNLAINHKISDVNFELIKSTQKIANRKFSTFEYNFHCNILSIIVKIINLEDAIEFFQRKWGYHEDGEEIMLLDYSVGEIISTTEDSNGDYIIIDYEYCKNVNNEDNDYLIHYVYCKILNTKGVVIRYGDKEYSDGKNFKPNRGDRLNTLLN